MDKQQTKVIHIECEDNFMLDNITGKIPDFVKEWQENAFKELKEKQGETNDRLN